MLRPSVPIVILACQVFRGLFERFLPAGVAREPIYLEYGLHDTPKRLRQAIQEALDALQEPSLVLLGYGLCGNGLDGIRAGVHTLLIPRADDCIAVFLGSYERYRREFEAEPATYYLTKGWLESGSNPLQEYERWVVKYGQAKAEWLTDQLYHSYKRIAFVADSIEDLQAYRGRAREVAHFCERWNMRYEEILGSAEFFEKLIETSAAPERASGDSLLVLPGGELRQHQFLRVRG